MSEAYDDFQDRLLVLVGNMAGAMRELAEAQLRTMAALVEMPPAIATGDEAALRKAVDAALDALEIANQRVGGILEDAHRLLERRHDCLTDEQERMRGEMDRLLAERRELKEQLENRDDG